MVKKVKKTFIFSLFISIFLACSAFILMGCDIGKVKLEDINFKYDRIDMYRGQVMDMEFDITPAKANDYRLRLSSSDNYIASFNQRAQLVAHNYTEDAPITITLEVLDSDIIRTCDVYINDGNISYVYIDYDELDLIFYEGQKLTFDNFKVMACYQSGKRVNIPLSECTIDAPEKALANTTISITYKDYYTEPITLNVRSDTELELSLDSLPTKTEYFIGETFESEGMKLSLNYLSGKKVEITDYTYSTDPLDVGQTSIQISYKNYNISIPITVKARKTANSLQQLQTLINEGCDSIKLANGLAFSTSTPLVLEIAENITIFAESSNCYINGNSIMPIVIKGKIKNVRFINFGISSSGNSQLESLIDLSQCTGGTLLLKNMTFSVGKDKVFSNPNEVDFNETFNNCKYNTTLD